MSELGLLPNRTVDFGKSRFVCSRCKKPFAALEVEQEQFCPRCKAILEQLGELENKILKKQISLGNDESEAVRRILVILGKEKGERINQHDEEIIDYLLDRLVNDTNRRSAIISQLRSLQKRKKVA